MKNVLTICCLVILVWGCTKKMAPAKSETPSSNTGAVINQPMSTETNTGTAATSQAPAQNTGITGTKVADSREISAAETAAIAGQAIYTAKCGRCHGYKVTTDYTADRWAGILAVMAPRANLTEEERNNVYAYVKANSKK